VSQDVTRLVEHVVCEDSARIIASLIGACGGDFQLAEDALQDALILALDRWQKEGPPRHPEAWLIATARHRAIDQLRRDQTLARKREQLEYLLSQEQAQSGVMPLEEDTPILQDDRLRLIFTCCHPALAQEAQIALTLKTVAGLDVPEIARAFLVSSDTMAKRLTRARGKIRDARIPYQVPEDDQLPDRLSSVLTVIYLVFNEGYLSAASTSLLRSALCDEAIRLGRLLLSLMPDEPEVRGLLGLMLLNDSRRSARTDTRGDMLTLDEQDRSQWDAGKISEGVTLVEEALRARRPGPFQIQAAIAAVHAESPEPASTDWRQIALLYDQLMRYQPSPVVALNRAAAIGMAAGPGHGLRLMDDLEKEGGLENYYLLPAARADLLRRAGRLEEARAAYEQAFALCTNPVEQRYLQRRLHETGG